MAQVDDKKIKDLLNSPDTDLLMLVNKQFGTPNAELAKSILNYRLYDTMVELTQTFKENQKESSRNSHTMFWLAVFMACIALLQLILIITPLLI